MTKNIEVTHLIGTLEYIGDELSNIANKPSVEINKEGVTPTETAETITIGDDSYSIGGGGGSYSMDVIMGDLNRTYGTTPSNYIGTFNQWVAIDNGKSFSDYNAIMIVGLPQGTGSVGKWFDDDTVPVELLKHYDKVQRKFGMRSSTTQYIEYALDYTNNKFYLINFSYFCPIALIGIKY